jgi:hemolysin activation/secretion protein
VSLAAFGALFAAVPAHSQSQATYRYKRILISDTEVHALEMQAAPNSGPVVVEGVPILATPEFAKFIARYLGQPISTQTANQMAQDISKYMRDHDRLVVAIKMPTQDITTGDFRIGVTVGRYNQVRFNGNRWFSDRQLQEKLGIKPGDEIRLSTLEQAVNWANTNPFRHIQVILDTVNQQPGSANLDVAVDERIPIRVATSYDDTGSDIIGNNHYTAAIQFGNLWDLDHQFSYQFTTTDISHLYEAQNWDYKLPLPWHDFIEATAAYAVVEPSFEQGLFNLKGKDVVADLRYISPIERDNWSVEFSGGLDFKQINNNLLFGGTQVLNQANNVAQLTGGATVVRRDAHGSWVVGLNLDASPGGINSRDRDKAYENARVGAESRYLYGTLVVQRTTNLPMDFQLNSHAQLQASSANLLSSEELLIGGEETVRGYNERLYAGDQGYIFNQEVVSPAWHKRLPFQRKTEKPMETRLFAFWDYARVMDKHDTYADTALDPLMSAGLGLRANLAANFSASLDYGWQILDTTPAQPNRSRLYLRATLAY